MRDPPPPTLVQVFAAELLGTFVLVFIGCGAIMTGALAGTGATLPVAMAFGAAVAAVVYAFGHVSGSHVNPAVTLAFWVAGVHPTRRVLPYVLAQVLGALAAAAALRWTIGDVARLGATVPLDGNWQRAFAAELALTFVLVLVVCGSGLDRRAPAGFSGVAVGLAYAAGILALGMISGASMNPARSFGPAVVAGAWQDHWLYWVAPILGALLAAGAYRLAAPSAFTPSAQPIETKG
jgi:aquaporin Z